MLSLLGYEKKYCHVFIEGNIGAGKSTIIAKFCKLMPTFTAFGENVDKWMERGLLQGMYTDPQRYFLLFQLYVLFDRLCRVRHDGKNKIMERSGLADRMVFFENAIQNNRVSNMDVKIYDDLYYNMLNRFDLYRNSIFIYLDVDPEICRDRIEKRNRDTEVKAVDMKYVREIDRLHRECLIPYLRKNKIPIYVIKNNGSSPDSAILKIKKIVDTAMETTTSCIIQ